MRTATRQEKDFNPIFSKANRFKQDMLDRSAADTSLIPKLDSVCTVSNACRKLISPLKSFAKTGKK